MAETVNPGTCDCQEPQYGPIIFNSVGYQRAANSVYTEKSSRISAGIAGTLTSPNGNPIFKSNYERIQYLHGRSNQVSGCGFPPRVFALGTN